jgi:hypothetical protein
MPQRIHLVDELHSDKLKKKAEFHEVNNQLRHILKDLLTSLAMFKVEFMSINDLMDQS